MKESLMSVLGLLFLAALTGCSSRGNLSEIRPVKGDLSEYSNLLVSVESNVAEDVEEERVELQDMIVADLASQDAFSTVGIDDGTRPEDSTLLMKIFISDIKKVGGVKRYFLGVFAGRAKVVTEVRLVDGSTSQELGRYEIVGESATAGGGTTTGDAVTEAAEAICELVMDLRAKPVT